MTPTRCEMRRVNPQDVCAIGSVRAICTAEKKESGLIEDSAALCRAYDGTRHGTLGSRPPHGEGDR